jgi:hypothetical protein
MMVKNTNNVQVYDKGSPKELKNILWKSWKHCKGLLTVGEIVCARLEKGTIYIYIMLNRNTSQYNFDQHSNFWR